MTNNKLQRNNINSPGIIEQRYAILPTLGMEEAKNRRFWITFSSEEPAERFFGLEILDHKQGSVLLDWLSSGNAPLLLNHDHTKQIGVIEAAELTGDGKARAKVRFSRSPLAESIYQDVLDGIRSNISVGYRYLSSDIVLEKESKGNKPPVFRIKRWEPLEISVVSIPADPTIGIGRSKEKLKEKEKQEKQEPKKVSNYKYGVRNSMENEQVINENTNFVNDIRTINTVNTEQITKDIRQNETNRINEILALGDKHNMRVAAMEFIREGKSLDNFRQKILEHLGNQQTIETTLPDQGLIGMSRQEVRSFSIVKAIKAAIAGNWRGAELEREASTEVSKRIGREPASFFIPADVMLEQNNYERKDLQKLVNTAGGYLVSTDYLSGNFIELLRNKMLVRQMGAKVMSGLHGDIAIPKQTGGATAFWVAESESPQKSQQTFGQVTLSPKSIAAYTDFSRKLILQASPDIEQLVREDLATTIALEIDRAAILGSGKGAEPLGILNHKISKVNIADGEEINFGKIVDLESSIASKNADIGSLGYLCNAALRGHLKQTEKADGTAQFIWESRGAESGFGYLNGYKVGTTNQMPADTLLFGNFADLIIGQWGVLDVLVDPYYLGTSGGIRIRLMQDIDIAVRHPESFAVAKK